MNLSIYHYKPDQGRMARGVLFWLCTALIYYGCQTLYYFLHWSWAQTKLIQENIPILDIPLNPALIIALVLFIAIEFFLIKTINRPKLGNLLIETETEMKKVTWPSWGDSFNSSIVVLIAVIFFMGFLFLTNIVLTFIFRKVVFGG
jgi:preprotein translocase SecE subunit